MSDRYLSHACFILVIICFMSTAAPVLAVNPDEIEAHIISPENARVLADAALLEFVLSGSPGLESGSWEGSGITPNPVTIYDTNGEPLFYQFEVSNAGDPLGGIKIGASRVLPSSVMTIELTPPYWDEEEAEDMAEASLLKVCPGCTIISSEPVCYSYPKIGQRITYARPGSNVTEEYILDTATSHQVTPDSSWSYYGSIEEETVPGNQVAWDEEEAIHRLVLEKAQMYGYSETTTLSQAKMEALRELTTPFYKAGSGGAVVLGAGEATTAGKKVLSINLYPQEKGDWCAVAALQMISDYFGTSYTQNDIARLTNTDGGMYVEDEVEFFINHLGMQESYADYSPSYQKEVYEIENDRPFGSNIESFTIAGGHARVGAGYNDEWGRSEIYIYDPWPVNKGSVYWEPYSAMNHISDVILRGSGDPRIQPPVAHFSYTLDGTTVTFTDLTTENPNAWYWTFGDGTTTTSRNPSHTYAQSGSYWVTLTASNSGGSSRSILAVYIPGDVTLPTATPTSTPTVSLKPIISPKVFPTAVPTPSPTVPVTTYPTLFPKVNPTIVVPTPSPTVPVTTYPTIVPKVYPTIVVPTPSQTVPATTYPTIFPKVYPTVVVPTSSPAAIVTPYPTISPKVYPTAVPTTASVTPGTTYTPVFPKVYPTSSPITLPTGSPLTYTSSFIPVANFNHMIKGISVIFTDTSVGPTAWLWDFGDGTSSTASNPIHTYTEPGTFTVSLKVTNSAGSSTTSKSLTVGSSVAG
jgi:PKD repeat protein